MRIILLILLVFFSSIVFSQGRRDESVEVPVYPRVFETDTTGTYGGRIMYSDNNESVKLVGQDLFVNKGPDYLIEYYNYAIGPDSIIRIYDTILYRTYPLYKVRPEDSTVVDTLSQHIGFYWRKSLAPPSDNFINAPSSVYLRTNSDCVYYNWTDSHWKWDNVHFKWVKVYPICREFEICDLPSSTTDYWCSDAHYTKIFEDNFEGTELDLKHWRIGYPGGSRTLLPTSTLGWAAKKNAIVSGGALMLMCTNEPSTTADSDGTPKPSNAGNFVDGVISANFQLSYGKFEIRARIPQIKGVSPCYWLAGDDIEIDGWEFFKKDLGDRPTMSVYSTEKNKATCDPAYHNYGGTTPIYRVFQVNAGPYENQNVWQSLPNLADGAWRNYTIVYDPNYIAWFVEDEATSKFWSLVYSRKRQNNATNIDPTQNCSCTGCRTTQNLGFPVNAKPNNISFILNNVATESGGGNFFAGVWSGQSQTGPTSPSVMQIDWVKVYQRDDCGQNKTLTQTSGIGFQNTTNSNVNHITGDNISLGGLGATAPFKVTAGPWPDPAPNVLASPYPLMVRANNEISLNDGFIAEDGSLFDATIAFAGNGSLTSDCTTNNYWPQYARTTSSRGDEIKIENGIKKLALVTEYRNNDEVLVFPNPNTGSFTVKFESKSYPNFVEIQNAIGEIILKISDLKSAALYIDMKDNNPGMYFVKLHYSDKTVVKKIVVQ
jgi:beta-glucanase (GH16 family)